MLVALAARMWRLIRLRRVVRLVRVWWGLLVSGTRKAAGSAALVLVDGAVPLRPEPALFEAMLEGWTPTGFVDTIRSGTMVYEERTGSGTGSQEVHPGI